MRGWLPCLSPRSIAAVRRHPAHEMLDTVRMIFTEKPHGAIHVVLFSSDADDELHSCGITRQRCAHLIESHYPMPTEKPYNRKHPIPPDLYDPARCAEPPGPQLLLGIEQFNRQEFFACHETLEAAWNAEPAPVRTLYKGILQVGVGCYHLLRHNYRGAVLKLRTGADYLEPFAPRCMGVEVGPLIAEARRLHDALVALGPERFDAVDLAMLPVVRLSLSS